MKHTALIPLILCYIKEKFPFSLYCENLLNEKSHPVQIQKYIYSTNLFFVKDQVVFGFSSNTVRIRVLERTKRAQVCKMPSRYLNCFITGTVQRWKVYCSWNKGVAWQAPVTPRLKPAMCYVDFKDLTWWVILQHGCRVSEGFPVYRILRL